MQLITEVKNRVLYFHGGTKVFVTQEQENEITRLSTTDLKGCKINGHWTTFSSIARFGEISDYYNDHPEERPEYRPEWKAEPVEGYKSLEEQALATERGRNGLIEGLNRFINSAQGRGENPVHAMEILENYKAGRLTGAEKRKKGYWQAVYEKLKDKSDRNESEEKHYQYALNKINEVKVFA
jgi:hypothetical protein